MRPLYGVVCLSEVSAARRVLIYYGNGKFNSCVSCCPFNGRCPLFGLSAFGSFTVYGWTFTVRHYTIGRYMMSIRMILIGHIVSFLSRGSVLLQQLRSICLLCMPNTIAWWSSQFLLCSKLSFDERPAMPGVSIKLSTGKIFGALNFQKVGW